jgi:hypothetical protein
LEQQGFGAPRRLARPRHEDLGPTHLDCGAARTGIASRHLHTVNFTPLIAGRENRARRGFLFCEWVACRQPTDASGQFMLRSNMGVRHIARRMTRRKQACFAPWTSGKSKKRACLQRFEVEYGMPLPTGMFFRFSTTKR